MTLEQVALIDRTVACYLRISDHSQSEIDEINKALMDLDTALYNKEGYNYRG